MPPGGTNGSVGGTNSNTNGIKRKYPPHWGVSKLVFKKKNYQNLLNFDKKLAFFYQCSYTLLINLVNTTALIIYVHLIPMINEVGTNY